jgi:twitching motility protein PilI
MNADYLQVGLSKKNSLLIPTTNAVEVISRKRSDICPIPGLLSSLLGVVNQRGRLLWVLDLASLLGLADDRAGGGKTSPQSGSLRDREKKLDREEVTIVILADDRERGLEERQSNISERSSRSEIGCLVAGLQEMVSLESDRIEPIDPDFSTKINDFFSGMTITEKLSLPILNIANLLAHLQNNSLIT